MSEDFEIENDVLVKYNGTDKSVTVPEGVRVIGRGAFGFCDFLEEIELPSSLEMIEDIAFFACSSLKQIDFPIGLKQIGVDVFACCHALEQVTIPLSVEKIGMFAFCDCMNLKRARIPVCLCEQVKTNHVFDEGLADENIKWYGIEMKAEIPPDTKPEIPPETNTVAREERTDTVPDLTETRPELEG